MDPEPRLLTFSQAAESLGVSTKTVYKLLAAKDLRGVRLLHDTRIPTAELDALIERRLAEASETDEAADTMPALTR